LNYSILAPVTNRYCLAVNQVIRYMWNDSSTNCGFT
jgi:hypothetical protein